MDKFVRVVPGGRKMEKSLVEAAMKIERIEALHLRTPRVEPKSDGTQEVLVVRVVTDAGLVGHGEAVSNATVVRAVIEAPRSAPFRHGLAVALAGLDPLDPAARWADMYEATRWYGRRGAAMHAMAAVDTALWDMGRPRVAREVRALIRQMSLANRLWGAPRIHGELLKLGIEIAQSTVAKYMVKRRRPPSQSWAIFLRNHADGIAATDLLVVPTVDFRLLYCLGLKARLRRVCPKGVFRSRSRE